LVERLRYEHTAAFDYTVHVQPSTLYSDEVIGPITAPPVGATAPVTPTLYTKLARSLDLGFNYALKSPHPLDVGGELSAVLQVQAENGWSKTLELLPPAPFVGPTASFRTGVDLAQVLSLIETIEKETGFNAGSYQLAVIPTVHVRGQIDGNLVEETYAPPFTMKLNRTQITPASPLTDSQVKTLADKVTLEQGFPLPGLWLPVMTARWLSGLGAALTLFATVVLAVVVFLGLGRGEVQKVRARYGSLLVSVAQADLKEDGQRIQVASMRDLARLAERDGRIIFDQKLGPESHLYFIQDGEVTYQYAVAPPAEEVNLAT
ncbi:MAG: DUF5305 family protein, partial [Dehalococcoidia bacterium]|nr:DUF5305 family protein [Dehalococcoidia bacterium]